jgi:DNA-binding MarR family transcriptional regulator
MSASNRSQPTGVRSNRRTDLGIVDALVQSSFLVQEMLDDVAAEHELSIIQTRLLGVLRDREPRMAHLAQMLGLSKQSTTGLVNRAERRGFVSRISIPIGDERAVHVSLTEQGRGIIEQISAQVSLRVAMVTADLTETNLSRLSKLLSQLVLRDADQHGRDLDPPMSRAAILASQPKRSTR